MFRLNRNTWVCSLKYYTIAVYILWLSPKITIDSTFRIIEMVPKRLSRLLSLIIKHIYIIHESRVQCSKCIKPNFLIWLKVSPSFALSPIRNVCSWAKKQCKLHSPLRMYIMRRAFKRPCTLILVGAIARQISHYILPESIKLIESSFPPGPHLNLQLLQHTTRWHSNYNLISSCVLMIF